MIRPLLIAAFIALIGCLTAPSGLFAADSDLERVQGEWKTTMETPDGDQEASMTVEGKKLHFEGPKPLGSMEVTFELDWNVKPKRMSMVIESCDVDEMKGLSIEGIYVLEKKTWIICATAPGSPEGPSGFDDEKAQTIEFKKVD